MGGLAKKLLATAVEQSLEPIAGAVDFDGTNDHMSRSSDLVGNADGKTFTFSTWVWLAERPPVQAYLLSSHDGTYYKVNIYFDANLGIVFRMRNAAGGDACYATVAVPSAALGTFAHIVASFDTGNQAGCKIYVNDQVSVIGWQGFSVGAQLDFTSPTWMVGRSAGSTAYRFKGRLAHVYLDYTYRDLSIEANRRLFITADCKPAEGLEELNPILYLPLTDPTQPGKNLGTGGDFALTGVVARSGRGPNQFNAAYSDLDGVTQHLLRTTALAGAANGKQLTLHFCVSFDSVSGSPCPISFERFDGASYAYKLLFSVGPDGSAGFVVNATPSGTAVYAVFPVGTFKVGRNYLIAVSLDVADASRRFIFINGEQASVAWTIYADTVMWLSLNAYHVGLNRSSGGTYTNGRVGSVFFDTRYIELSAPDNLAKFVTGTGIDAKPVDLGANGEKPFGTPPLIYLPMYGNNAGKNYGTGGDFTVNSGPFPGVRGPNEYWGNKADFNGTTGSLGRSSVLAGVGDSKIISGSFWFAPDALGSTRSLLTMGTPFPRQVFSITVNSDSKLSFSASNPDTNSAKLGVVVSAALVVGAAYFVQFCFDLTDPTKRFVYINGASAAFSVSVYVNEDVQFSKASGVKLGQAWYDQSTTYDGKLSEFYFTTDYIDFSQEANRLKFRDAFGNPVALLPQIEAGGIPNPAIYMRFDPASVGKNHGTGGDFAVNGTITDGGQL